MISIQNGMKISTVQDIFNTAFPFLKLEFFRYPHPPPGSNTSRKDLLKYATMPDAHLTARGGGGFIITGNMSVTTLEQMFMEHFGLWAQLLRKSGNLWLETTRTDDWTLEKQNEEGRELSALNSPGT